jgi:hypothetical protein
LEPLHREGHGHRSAVAWQWLIGDSFPSTILLYTEGQGLPKDRSQAKADEYFKKVVAKVKALVLDPLQKWDAAGFK